LSGTSHTKARLSFKSGQLTVVRSRHDRFRQLPLIQQFYILWHTDVYHVDWSDYAGQWARYVYLIQNYLPLVWEMQENVSAGSRDNVHDLTNLITEVFYPLWQQEGLLRGGPTPTTFFELYEQSALPAVIAKLFIQDILVRYGLINITQDLARLFGAPARSAVPASGHIPLKPTPPKQGEFTWTPVGHALLPAEKNQDLPCGIELLDS